MKVAHLTSLLMLVSQCHAIKIRYSAENLGLPKNVDEETATTLAYVEQAADDARQEQRRE